MQSAKKYGEDLAASRDFSDGEEADRYVADARALIEEGNALRDRGLRGSDADMVLSPTRFLELLAEVWEQGFDLGVRHEGDRPVNPYRYPEEER